MKSGLGGGRLILLTGVLLFACMLTSLVILSKALQNPAQFDEFYTGLLIFNTLGLLALVILIGLNIRSLINQARERIAGARLTVRMVTMFAILSVTPVLIPLLLLPGFPVPGHRQLVRPARGTGAGRLAGVEPARPGGAYEGTPQAV